MPIMSGAKAPGASGNARARDQTWSAGGACEEKVTNRLGRLRAYSRSGGRSGGGAPNSPAGRASVVTIAGAGSGTKSGCACRCDWRIVTASPRTLQQGSVSAWPLEPWPVCSCTTLGSSSPVGCPKLGHVSAENSQATPAASTIKCRQRSLIPTVLVPDVITGPASRRRRNKSRHTQRTSTNLGIPALRAKT